MVETRTFLKVFTEGIGFLRWCVAMDYVHARELLGGNRGHAKLDPSYQLLVGGLEVGGFTSLYRTRVKKTQFPPIQTTN